MENLYIGFFKGRELKIRAKSLWDAKKQALDYFKPNKANYGLVGVELAELADGSTVVHFPE